jgi:prevent-host-death family protein
MVAAIEVGAYQAKTHLSELLRAVREGNRYVITHHGERVAELSPISAVPDNASDIIGQMQRFMAERPQNVEVDSKSLIEDGRD